MAQKEVRIRVSTSLLEKIDKSLINKGIARSEFIREAISEKIGRTMVVSPPSRPQQEPRKYS